MREGFVGLVMLLSTAAIASAEQVVSFVTSAPPQEIRVTADDVVARLMSFDRNHDGKVSTAELSERMQPIVARGDRSSDDALDASEIRDLALARQELFAQVPNAASAGRYSLGDGVGQSSRLQIENTIDDLRLPAELSVRAKRIGQAFADEMDAAARAHAKTAMEALLMPDAFLLFESDLARFSTMGQVVMTSINGSTRTVLVVGADPTTLLRKYTFGPDERKAATAVMETFKAELQLDEARRSALISQLSDVLNEEDCDNVRAALVRRPLVKGGGAFGGGVAASAEVERMLVMVPGQIQRPATTSAP